MNQEIKNIVDSFSANAIPSHRKEVLQPFIQYLQNKLNTHSSIRLNFICTHNSRRSHLSQIWAQTMAFHFGLKNVICYSGGTEVTAVFPKIMETLTKQGFQWQSLAEIDNPIYAVKFAKNEAPILCFSKEYLNGFNPTSAFCAIMTCSTADHGCPFVLGADARFPIQYEDPKKYDGTDQMDERYAERSLEIGQEMWYVFSELSED
jgi:arsenate reductase